MSKIFFSVFMYFILAIATLGGIYGLIKRKSLRKAYLWLAIFLLSSGVLQYASIFVTYMYHTNVIFISMLTPIYYLLIYLIFSNLSKNRKTLFILNMVFLIGFVPLLLYSAKSISNGNLAIEAISIGNMVYSLGSMILFLDMVMEPFRTSPFKQAKFYVLTACLFYHSAIIFFWAVQKLFEGHVSSVSTNLINYFMLFIYYTILFGALIVENKYGLKDG